jgi:hypothetical protein
MTSVDPSGGNTTPKAPKLWKRASLDWLNRPRTLKTKPSSGALRINLSFGGVKESSGDSESSNDGSPPLPSSGTLKTPTTTRSAYMRADSEVTLGGLATVKALASREILVNMLDDPKCLWKFGQFLSYEVRPPVLAGQIR